MNLIDQLVVEASKPENKDFHRRLYISLQRLVHKIQLDVLDTKKKNDGYCATFVIPERDVFHLFDEIGLSKEQIAKAFASDWQVPADAKIIICPFN